MHIYEDPWLHINSLESAPYGGQCRPTGSRNADVISASPLAPFCRQHARTLCFQLTGARPERLLGERREEFHILSTTHTEKGLLKAPTVYPPPPLHPNPPHPLPTPRLPRFPHTYFPHDPSPPPPPHPHTHTHTPTPTHTPPPPLSTYILPTRSITTTHHPPQPAPARLPLSPHTYFPHAPYPPTPRPPVRQPPPPPAPRALTDTSVVDIQSGSLFWEERGSVGVYSSYDTYNYMTVLCRTDVQ